MTQWGLDALFNPAKRHMDEEKRRLQSTREEIGDSSGGKRIDFDTGKVTIHRPGDEQPSDETEAPGEAADEAQQQPQHEKPSRNRAKTELTPAQQRAAERRRRKQA